MDRAAVRDCRPLYELHTRILDDECFGMEGKFVTGGPGDKLVLGSEETISLGDFLRQCNDWRPALGGEIPQNPLARWKLLCSLPRHGQL